MSGRSPASGEEHQDHAPTRRNARRIAIVAIVLLILALPKIVPAVHGLMSTDDDLAVEIVPVDAFVVQEELLDETLRASGTLLANREVELSAESSGIVTSVRIDEGSRVTAGQLLVRINDNDLRAELTGVEYEIEMVAAQAARQERLVEEGGTTRDALDQTLVRLSELRSAREILETQISRREIRAPFNGVVGLAYVDPGTYLTPGTRIATLQALDSVRVDFSVSERYASVVAPGNPLRFTVQGSDSVFVGEVRAVEPRVDARTRALRVRGIASNEDGSLRSGAFADVEIVIDSIPGAMRVPAIALQQGAEGPSVFVASSNGVVETRRVEIGRRNGDFVRIVEGLHPGDTVILNGFHRLRDGASVVVRDTTGTTIDDPTKR